MVTNTNGKSNFQQPVGEHPHRHDGHTFVSDGTPESNCAKCGAQYQEHSSASC